MLKRLSYSQLLLFASVVPAFAGDGGSLDGGGALLIQAVSRLISKLAGLL